MYPDQADVYRSFDLPTMNRRLILSLPILLGVPAVLAQRFVR